MFEAPIDMLSYISLHPENWQEHSYVSLCGTAEHAMLKRNRHLVDNSSVCICYLTESTGGTAYTVEYARKSGLTIVNLA